MKKSQKLYEIYFNHWVSVFVSDEIMKETKATYADRPEEERDMSWMDFIQEYGFVPDGASPMNFERFVEEELEVYELARDIYDCLIGLEGDLPREYQSSFAQVSFAEGVVEIARAIDDKDVELDNIINDYIEELKDEVDTLGNVLVEVHRFRDYIDAYHGDLSDEAIEKREPFYRAYFGGINNPEHYNEVYTPVVKMVCRQLCEWVDAQKCEAIMAHSPLAARGTQWAAEPDFRKAVLDEAVSKSNKPKEVER